MDTAQATLDSGAQQDLDEAPALRPGPFWAPSVVGPEPVTAAAVPVTAAAVRVRRQVGDRRWAEVTRKAQVHADIVKAVRNRHETDGSTPYAALHQVSPETPWPTYQHWARRVEEEQSDSWESLVDRRVPPRRMKIPERVRASAITMRRLCPGLRVEEALKQLVAQHGEAGDISKSSLFRIWNDAGLPDGPKENVEEVVVEEFHGGAGLALIRAAAIETGAMQKLAEAALTEGRHAAQKQLEKGLSYPDEPSGRDERGHLTAEYNNSTRAGVKPGQKDDRWTPDFAKRAERDLTRLQVLEHSPYVVARKLLAVGVLALVTERRGFDGLDGPRGDLLATCSDVGYMPGTLDKFLAQLAFLDVEDALWEAHATISSELIVRWASAEGTALWLRVVIYIDSTQEPYWTREYAKSGKVSRTGRVGPCLTRIMITGGPGVPLLIETFAGTVSLKTELPRLLARVEAIIGPGELGRFTVIDAEMATAKLLHALKSDSARSAITVLKGRSVPKNFVPGSDWQTFRERDQVRDGNVVLHGKDAPQEGVSLRVVEMRRPGRHSHSTFFGAIGKDTASMTPQEVADTYLTRWPHEESVFRNTRNGLGLDRTHGFGGEMVQHVSIETKAEKAERRLLHTQEQLAQAEKLAEVADRLKLKAKKADAQTAAELSAHTAAQAVAAKKAIEAAQQEVDALKTTPRLIYERDTARENVITVAKATVMVLIEFVLREYFGGLRIELRTFIEYFVNLPVTIRTSSAEIRYQIETSQRNSERTKQLEKACAEINRRELTLDGRRMVFELVGPRLTRVELRRV